MISQYVAKIVKFFTLFAYSALKDKLFGNIIKWEK